MIGLRVVSLSENSRERNGSRAHFLWRVRLFDGPVLEGIEGREVRRFRSRNVGVLLAYLALHLGHPCPRETLCLALWPEDDTKLVANRLRVALASLRRQLEPADVSFGSVHSPRH